MIKIMLNVWQTLKANDYGLIINSNKQNDKFHVNNMLKGRKFCSIVHAHFNS